MYRSPHNMPIALRVHDLGRQMVVGGQHHAPATLPPGKREAVFTTAERGWGWAGQDGFVEKKLLETSGFGPRLVQPLYRLRYCGPSSKY